MKNKFFLQILTVLAVAVLMQSCSKENATTTVDVKTEKGVEVYSPSEIKGLKHYNGHEVDYHVNEEGDFHQVVVKIDDLTLEATVAYEPLSLTYNGHGAILKESQKAALAATAQELAELVLAKNGIQGDFVSFNETENTIVRVLGHWSEIPAGYVLGEQQSGINIDRSLGDDGIKCVKRGRYYYVSFDNSSGTAFTEYRKAGYTSNVSTCMGLCGGNCGYWWWPKTWTLDCFEHDQCYATLNTGGGPTNGHCGDEWFDAADDFLFGYIAGCRG